MSNEAPSFNPEESEELKLQESAEQETPKEIKAKLGGPSSKTVDVVQAEEADLGPREKLFKATEKSKKAEQYRDYVGKSFEKSYGEEGKKDKPIFKMAEKLVEQETGKKAAAIKELKAKILKEIDESDIKIAEKAGNRFQKIRVTPELEAVQKKTAQRDIENAHAKLAKAEYTFAEAEKNRPGAFSRFFSRFGKLSAAEMTYQQAVRAVSEAKNQLEETKRSILNSGIYMERKKRTPGEEENKTVRVGDGRGISVRGIVQKEKTKAEEKKLEKPIARKPAPTIISGEHKIVFKQEPTQSQHKIEVKTPPAKEPEQEFESVVVSEAEEQLENYIKGMFFKGENTKQLIFQNAALMERLIDVDFHGDQRILNKVIMGAKNEMLKKHKLDDEERYKFGTAKFNDLTEGGKLATQLKAVFKKQPENYQQFLALEDLYEANTTYKGVPQKKPTRPAPPIFRNY